MERTFLLLALAVVVGCSSETASPVKTYPASGKVTLNGRPLEGATVNFIPADGKGSSVGTTDKDGMYKLTTYRSDDGAPAGQYKVSIVKYDAANPPPAATTGPPPNEIDFSNYAPPSNSPNAPAVVPTNTKETIPAKYANADSSGLRGMIDPADPKNENNFDLK